MKNQTLFKRAKNGVPDKNKTTENSYAIVYEISIEKQRYVFEIINVLSCIAASNPATLNTNRLSSSQYPDICMAYVHVTIPAIHTATSKNNDIITARLLRTAPNPNRNNIQFLNP